VVLEQLSIADAAAQRVDRFVSALIHHFENRLASSRRGRQESGSQRVAGKLPVIQASAFGVRLNN
jgi:hypothetical protein